MSHIKLAQQLRDHVAVSQASQLPARPTSPFMASALQNYLVSGRNYPVRYLRGEAKEFMDALRNNDHAGIEEELQDMMFALQMMAYQQTGKDRTVIGADDKINAFIDRIGVMQNMFKDHGLEFNTDYLRGGSNWQKPEKIQAAFRMAGRELGVPEAMALRDKYNKS